MLRMPDPGAPITTLTHTIADSRRSSSVALRSLETPAHRVRQIIVKRRTIVNRLRVEKSVTALDRGFALPDVLTLSQFFSSRKDHRPPDSSGASIGRVDHGPPPRSQGPIRYPPSSHSAVTGQSFFALAVAAASGSSCAGAGAY